MFVTVLNTGFRTWGATLGVEPDQYSFIQNGQLSPFALVESIELPRDVKVRPGQTTTFSVRFRRAPSNAQRPSSFWQMRIERAAGGDRLDSAGPELFGQTMRIPVPKLPRWCN